MCENSMDDFSKNYLNRLDKHKNDFIVNVINFLKSDYKKCLLIESPGTKSSINHVRQSIKKLAEDIEDTKNFNNYLSPENQIFLEWSQLIKINSSERVPEFKSLLVCEIPKTEPEDMVGKVITNIIDQLNTSVSKKVVLVISQKNLLNTFLQNIEIRAFLKIDDYDAKVLLSPYADDSEALIESASRGRFGDVEELLKNTINVNTLDLNTQTALHKAAENGHTHVVSFLLQNEAKTTFDIHGYTPLHLAVKNGHKDVVAVLVENMDNVDISGNNKTALFCAVDVGQEEIVKLLLEKGANVFVKDNLGPLHVAAEKNLTEIVTTLLNYGADINATDRYKTTPLHKAALFGHVETVDLLMKKGADVNIKSIHGSTALDLAVLFKKDNVATLLKAKC